MDGPRAGGQWSKEQNSKLNGMGTRKPNKGVRHTSVWNVRCVSVCVCDGFIKWH